MDTRMSWDEYFMRIAWLVAERSSCIRRKVGAVAVSGKRMVASGYNGVPPNIGHCFDRGCLRAELGVPSGERHELCRGLHAEQNVIIQAAMHGASISGATVYSTHQPCLICTKMLIGVGVTTIFYAEPYPDELSQDMLSDAGVILLHLDVRP